MTPYSPQSGATTIAEDNPKFKVDVNLVFGGREKKNFVLRTTLNSQDLWKIRYPDISTADLPGRVKAKEKDALPVEVF